MTEEKKVVVIVAIGQKYLNIFKKRFGDSIANYANKIGAELVIVDDWIGPRGKHASWQKLLMFDHPRIAKYNWAFFLDADIFATKHAKDPFLIVGDKPWGIVNNNPYNFDYLTKTEPALYDCCPKENRPNFVVNTGSFVIRKTYKPLLEKVFNDYPEQGCRENGPLSYHLINDGEGVYLPPEFNVMVFPYRATHGQGLSKVIKMYEESSFIHFAGGKGNLLLPLLKYIDKTEKSVLKSIIYFFGKEKFDPMTGFLINKLDKFLAAIKYHVLRRFKKVLVSIALVKEG